MSEIIKTDARDRRRRADRPVRGVRTRPARHQGHLVDILPKPGGQCAELYPEKPIYDIPGFPIITGAGARRQSDEADRAVRADVSSITRWSRASRFSARPSIRCSGSAPTPARCSRRRSVIIAAGGGSFQPKKPPIAGIDAFEGSSVFYAVRKMEHFRGRRVVDRRRRRFGARLGAQPAPDRRAASR